MMTKAPTQAALRISALAWVVFVPVTALLFWPFVDDLKLDTTPLVYLALAGVLVGVACYLLGFLAGQNQRVLFFSGAAAMALVAVAFLLFSAGFAYFFLPLHSAPAAWTMRATLLISIAWWCVRELRGYKLRIIEKRFIEREFSVEPDRIVKHRPQKTDLSPPPVTDKTFLGRLYNRYGSYLIMGIPLAYPIQRVFSSAGGVEAVLLLTATLGTPLAIYILGRMTCGAYLWIYKVWQLEREHGKPVVFADVEA